MFSMPYKLGIILKEMRLKKENNLSNDIQLVNRSSGIQTQIQVIHAMDRNKIVMKSEN